MIPNPHGANGTTSDPREQICWDNYVQSIINGKENAKQAALDAGYEPKTAEKITVRSWFIERKAKLKRKDMLSKAERNLDEVLDIKYTDDEGKVNTQVLKIKTDTSVVIVKTLGKDEGYSDRTEIDHTTLGEKITSINYIIPDGNKLNPNPEATPSI